MTFGPEIKVIQEVEEASVLSFEHPASYQQRIFMDQDPGYVYRCTDLGGGGVRPHPVVLRAPLTLS